MRGITYKSTSKKKSKEPKMIPAVHLLFLLLLVYKYQYCDEVILSTTMFTHAFTSTSTSRSGSTSSRTENYSDKGFSGVMISGLATNSVGSSLSSTHQRNMRIIMNMSKEEENKQIDEVYLDVDIDIDVDVDSETQQYYSPNNIKTKPRAEVSSESEESSASISTSVNEYSFFDEAVIYTRAGSGGQGSSTYRKSGQNNQNGVPDGGNGGTGGNVYLVVDSSLNTLAGLNPGYRPNSFGGSGAALSGSGGMSYHTYRPLSFRAENGMDGERQFRNGKYGKDVYIHVPPSTIVQEEIDIFEEIVEDDSEDDDNVDGEKKKKQKPERVVIDTKLVDLGSVGVLEPDDENAFDDRGLPCNVNQLLVARGGDGGEGSGMQGYKKGRGVRRTRASPVGGERRRIKLTLKIVADVALVGVPNAGKSTFLAAVTRAKPKIANYPFTTVIPNLGVWIPPKEYNSSGQNGKSKTSGAGSEGLALCDVPGLIAGAADGIGLGHAFLRHVERCHVILHLVDATSSDPLADFHMVNDEILRYGNGKLAQMPQIVVVNKVDAWEEGSGEDWEHGLKTRMDKSSLEDKLKEAMTHTRLMWMSAKERDGVDDLMGRMAAFVKKVKSSSS